MIDPIPRNKSLDKPVLTKRQQLNRLIGLKVQLVHQPVVKLDVFKNMKETEALIRFRIQHEEKK